MAKQKKIKAGFLIFSLQGGGAERNVLNILRYIQKHTIVPYIISIKERNDYEREYAAEKKYITPLLPDKHIPLLLKPFKLLEAFFRFVKLVRREKIDVLIASGEYVPFYIVTIASFILKKKSVLVVGTNIIAEELLQPFLLKFFGHILFIISMRRADAIICVSNGLSKTIISFYGISSHKVHTVHNGIEKQPVIYKSQQHLPDQYKNFFRNNRIITSMGRLEHQKGFDHLIKAFYLTKKHIPHIKLILIGQGKSKEQLRILVQSLRLQSDVLFTGFLEDEKYQLIRNSDIFVLASRYEGFGNAILEALTIHTPVVSTDCPYGPRELLLKPNADYKKPLIYPYLGTYGVLSEPRPAHAPFQSEIDRLDHSLSEAIIVLLKQPSFAHKLFPIHRNTAQLMANDYCRIIASI